VSTISNNDFKRIMLSFKCNIFIQVNANQKIHINIVSFFDWLC
jgi:hypothetical protein